MADDHQHLGANREEGARWPNDQAGFFLNVARLPFPYLKSPDQLAVLFVDYLNGIAAVSLQGGFPNGNLY
jgi:hypothetical protein